MVAITASSMDFLVAKIDHGSSPKHILIRFWSTSSAFLWIHKVCSLLQSLVCSLNCYPCTMLFTSKLLLLHGVSISLSIISCFFPKTVWFCMKRNVPCSRRWWEVQSWGPLMDPPNSVMSCIKLLQFWVSNDFDICWLVVWNMNFMTFHSIELGMSSSQLTHILQRGGSTTNQFGFLCKIIHQIWRYPFFRQSTYLWNVKALNRWIYGYVWT